MSDEPDDAGDRKIYAFNVRREDRFWLIEVPELGELTQARNLGEVQTMVREIVAIAIGLDEDAFDVALGTFELPGTVDDHLNRALTLWLESDLEAGRAAQELRDAGVNVADIGRILGVSRVIARKLLVNADGVDRVRAMADQPGDPSKRRHTDAEIDAVADAFVDAVAVHRWRPLMARPGMAGRVAGATGRADDAVAATDAGPREDLLPPGT